MKISDATLLFILIATVVHGLIGTCSLFKTSLPPKLCETSSDYFSLVKDTFFEAYYDKVLKLHKLNQLFHLWSRSTQIKDMTFATDYILLTTEDVRSLRLEYDRREVL